uniref:Odorant receptor n=1 Tax=Manduca sexta TaxID=7130 RepID=A0A0P1IW73_MANSE|nr:Olfactory receptor 65 [Manduca sexta]
MALKYPWNKSKEWFERIVFWAYLSGLPNFWIEDLNFSKHFMKFYDKYARALDIISCIFVLLELLSVFTQHELSKKQQTIQILFCVGHPFLCLYSALMGHYKEKTRGVLLELVVTLKQVHNDPNVEKMMIKQCNMYSIAFTFSCFCSMLFYCVDSLIQVLKTGVTFNVVIPVWPIIADNSVIANVARVLYHIVWIIFMAKVACVYIIVISLSTCISHQYKNLQKYFESLNEIFLDENLKQDEKKAKYEEKFKIGVKAHAQTLRVTKESHEICNGVISGQIVFNIIMLTIIMYQTFIMTRERSLVKMMSTATTAMTVLCSTGFFMWNAGDITYEAAHTGTSMYSSGWQNCCRQSSIRVRKLLVVAIAHAQNPVIMRGLGIMELSHQSFVSIVKCSYSLFSLLY